MHDNVRSGCTLVIGLICGMLALVPEASIAMRQHEADALGSSSSDLSLAFKSDACIFPTLARSLSLMDAVERMLCHDPTVRVSWARTKAQAAIIGIRRAAFLPDIKAQLGGSEARSQGDAGSSNASLASTRTYRSNLDFSWLLYDFGSRQLSLDNANYLLLAANANHDATIQDAFSRSVQIYYKTQVAQKRVAAAEQVYEITRENQEVARAKYYSGTTSRSDFLQAEAAFTKSALRAAREKGSLETLSGEMALMMGISPNRIFEIEPIPSRIADRKFHDSIEQLLSLAHSQHPSLIAARARLDASKVSLAEAAAYGKPTLALTGSLDRLVRSQTGAQGLDRRQSGYAVGLQLNIPLSSNFERGYRIRDAKANIAASIAELKDIELRTSISVWQNYKLLKIESESLNRAAEIAEQSREALEVIRARYRAGVSSMTELLNATNAYSDAQDVHIAAINGWRLARVGLANSLGRLGFWVLE